MQRGHELFAQLRSEPADQCKLITRSTEHGTICAPVRFDPNLRPGVVAMTHGFGNGATAGMPNAQAYPGVNVNLLGPSGAGSFDPVSGMLQVTIPVDVAAVREPRSVGGPAE